MTKQLLAIGTLSAIAVFAQGTAATPTEQRTRPTPEQMVENRVARMTTLLSLSASQQMEIRSILLNEIQATQALRSTAESAHTNLKNAIANRAGDAQIDAAASQVGLVQGQLAAVHAKAQVRLQTVLTAEQREKLEALPHGPGGRGPGMFGPGGMGRPNGSRGPGDGGTNRGRGSRF